MMKKLSTFVKKGLNVTKNSSYKKKNKKLTINKQATFKKQSGGQWVVVGHSSIGKSHIKSGLPCQDENFFKNFDNSNWGIAVVCDGAGSASQSHVGANFLATDVFPKLLTSLLQQEQWIVNGVLPGLPKWEDLARSVFERAFEELAEFAKNNNYQTSELACTCIALIYSPLGFLIAHIGDGRAAYSDENGTWRSMMTPHKGEESNQTIFLTSGAWVENSKLSISGVRVPECRVITASPTGFAIMSDGCEQHSFECSIFDPQMNSWSDPNLPYQRFFAPLVTTLTSMVHSLSTHDFQSSWQKFLENGTDGLRNESDDKTMILGILTRK